MKELLTMSQKELTRLEIVQRLETKRVRQREVAKMLGVSERSSKTHSSALLPLNPDVLMPYVLLTAARALLRAFPALIFGSSLNLSKFYNEKLRNLRQPQWFVGL